MCVCQVEASQLELMASVRNETEQKELLSVACAESTAEVDRLLVLLAGLETEVATMAVTIAANNTQAAEAAMQWEQREADTQLQVGHLSHSLATPI